MSTGPIQKFKFGPWELETCKKSIATIDEYEKVQQTVPIPTIPEIMFSKNYLKLVNKQHAAPLELLLSPVDALKLVKNEPVDFKVAASEKWNQLNKTDGYKTSQQFDWTFYSNYSGTLSNEGSGEGFRIVPTDEPLDVKLLTQPSKILFFEAIDFYEDELGDHGISFVNVRVRCMDHSVLILMRSFVRIDKVAFLVHETRFHLKNGCNYIYKQCVEKYSAMFEIKSQKEDWDSICNEIPTIKATSYKLFYK